MGRNEIDIILRIGQQYLNPQYNEEAEGGLKAQKEQEEAIFNHLVAELAKKDQDVLKVWGVIKKKRNGK